VLGAQDNFLYVPVSYYGFCVLDISNPLDPEIIGFSPSSLPFYDLAIQDNYAYVACYDSGMGVYDISSPQNPIPVGSVGLDGWSTDVAVSGNYVYAVFNDNWNEWGFDVVDISIPGSPVIVGAYISDHYAYAIDLSGDYAYITTQSPIQVINISNPVSPDLVYSGYNYDHVYYLEFFGDYLFASETYFGLNILERISPTSLQLIGYYETPGWAGCADFDGQYIYFLDRYHFDILQCPNIVSAPPSSSNPLPTTFELYPPSPNPFNPATTITFGLPVASWVKVEVFDIAGRLVGLSGSGTTPTTGYFPAGVHEMTFDGSDLTSGIYLLRLRAGDFNAVEKMVLIK
jgi:hypothetical protein